MSCERNAKPLADVAAGRAPSPGLQAHLDGCSACRAELALLREALALADRALRDLASAEPAPELQARIRQAAAAAAAGSPARRWSTARWAFAAGCAALVVAVVLAGWSGGWWSTGGPRTAATSPQPDTSPRNLPAATQPAPTASPAPVRTERTLSGRSSREARGAVPVRRHGAAPVPRRAEPEVLVDPGQQNALARLVAVAHRPDVKLQGLAAAGQPSADLNDPADIEIKPLEIVPLDPAEASGT